MKGTLETPRAAEEGQTYGRRGDRNRLTTWGCRDQEVTGDQVEGGKTLITRTGGGDRWKCTRVQVGRRSNIGREEVESSAKRSVYLSIRVADGGGVRTRRLMGKYPVNS